jgi:hypothetical protein
MFNSLHIASIDRSCSSIINVYCSSIASNIFCAMSNFGFYYISTLITCINLSIVILVWDHNKLCNKQGVVKTSSTNEICNLVLVRNSMKVFLRMLKAFFHYEVALFLLLIIQQFQIVYCPFSLKRIIIPMMSG